MGTLVAIAYPDVATAEKVRGELGSLFDGDSVRAQVTAVRQQLRGIAGDCKAAMAGTAAR